MLLDRLCTAKYREIERLQALEAAGTFPVPRQETRPCFGLALRLGKRTGLLPVIAEYKRASPSCGVINESLQPEEVALQYRDAGATCISVLTEEDHFKGHLSFLQRIAAIPGMCPLLRKDFIFHPLQIRETASTAASAVLLMVRLTPDPSQLRDLRELAEAYGIEAVVEVFDAQELDLARSSGARLIQVNARNLETMDVSRQSGLDLALHEHHESDGELWIAASGLENNVHLSQAASAGYDAVLVGTSLMRNGTPGLDLQRLLA